MRGALWALGTLCILGGVTFGVMEVLAGSMSDAPEAGREAVSSGVWIAGSALVIGGSMIAGGFAF